MQHKSFHYLFLLFFFIGFSGFAQNNVVKTDKKLQKALEEITKDFKGVPGIYVYNLKTKMEAGINADTIFPTASIVKVPILTGVFKKIAQGDYKLHEPLVYDTIRAYGGSGIMQFFQDSTKTDLRTAAALMITYSDNTSSLWCQELAGGGKEINKLMADLGLEHTRVNSRTEG
ncbi:MAG TPA: serine hydrolase, partial [Salinimicrobium sp.]|nr:serine hydrolase [Salinimicrobium sp.]